MPHRNPILVALLLLAAFASHVGVLTAQQPAKTTQAQRFHDVKGWRGTLIAYARVKPGEAEALPARGATIELVAREQLDFELTEMTTSPWVWRGRIKQSRLEASYRGTIVHAGGYQEATFAAEGPLGFSTYGVADEVLLEFHHDDTWSVRMHSGQLPTMLNERITLNTGYTRRDSHARTIYGMGSTQDHAFTPDAKVLYATGAKVSSFFCSVTLGPQSDLEWKYSIYLEPLAWDELQLEIEEPAGYDTWLPTATLDGYAGAPITVTARVMTKDGKQPAVGVDSFEWKLVDTSREPGIALNFPADERTPDTSFDMGLDADGDHFVLLDDDQKLIRAVESGWSDTVRVDPYDFGAWSLLQVTAVLADGRMVMGRRRGDSGIGVRLPRRSIESKIASAWRRQRSCGVDHDDEDTQPVGDGNEGDGFSNYEEYRGFVHDGSHMRLDPKQKDLFVLNKLGEQVTPGILQFALLSELAVHFRLRPGEMRVGDRAINHLRSARSPRETQELQHYVEILKGINDGASSVTIPIRRPMRPRTVVAVLILQSLLQPGSEKALARHVCHELVHSVGVEHHGDGEGWRGWRKMEGRVGAVREFWFEEVAATRTAAATEFAASGQRIRIFRVDGSEVAAGDDEYLREPVLVWVAQHGGQHSGDVSCVMRYHVCGAYTQPGRVGDRFLCPREPAGDLLCVSPLGTSFNAPGSPVVRHGNATRGNCQGQICVRDDAPAKGQ